MIISTNTQRMARLLCLTLAVVWLGGCKENPQSITTSGTHGGLSGQLSTLVLADIISQYDTSNVTGVIIVNRDSVHYTAITTTSGTRQDVDGANYWADGYFADTTGNALDGIAVFVNLDQLAPSGEGSYSAGGSTPVVYGSSQWNHIGIAGFTYYPTVDDSVHFDPPVVITNVSRAQNISRATDSLALSWSGGTEGVIAATIMVKDTTVGDTIGIGYQAGGTFSNSGAAVIHWVPAMLRKGLADIILTKYDPHFITLSNGKRLCIINETSFTTSVNITD